MLADQVADQRQVHEPTERITKRPLQPGFQAMKFNITVHRFLIRGKLKKESKKERKKERKTK